MLYKFDRFWKLNNFHDLLLLPQAGLGRPVRTVLRVFWHFFVLNNALLIPLL